MFLQLISRKLYLLTCFTHTLQPNSKNRLCVTGRLRICNTVVISMLKCIFFSYIAMLKSSKALLITIDDIILYQRLCKTKETMKKQTLLLLAAIFICILPTHSEGFQGVGIAIKARSMGTKSMQLNQKTSPAVFPYGNEALNKYIYRHLPMHSLQTEYGKDFSTTEIVIQFNINSQGKVRNVIKVSSTTSRLADEIADIFRRMPRWIPAIDKCKPQDSTHRYTVHIVLNDELYGKPYIYCEPSHATQDSMS